MSELCPAPGDLLAYAEGATEDAASEAVARHVQNCDDCARRLREMRALTKLLRAGARPGEPGSDCANWELVAAYAEGSVSGIEAERVERHIAACPVCLAMLAELWLTESGPSTARTRDVERRVIAALAREAKTAVVSWRDGVATLLRGFAAALEEAETVLAGGPPEPVPALARGSRAVRFGWTGADGLSLECEVKDLGGRPALVGRVTKSEEPATAVSASLRGGRTSRGPESLDEEGRFGPWPLDDGQNELILTGTPVTGGRLELALELVRSG